MPIFRYIARDPTGEETTGSLEARSSVDAFNQLRRRGLTIQRVDDENQLAAADQAQPATALEKVTGQSVEIACAIAQADTHGQTAAADRAGGASSLAEMRLGIEDLAEIAGRIAGITGSQLPLTPGLRALSEELPSRSLRRSLGLLCNRLEQGESFEAILQSGDTAVPAHIAGLIVVGIRSRQLGQIMEWFLGHVRRQIDLRRRCGAALLYPGIVLASALVASAFGLLWIVPSLRTIYNQFQIELPALTVGLIALSDFVGQFWVYILAAILVPICGVPLALRALGGRTLQHRARAGIPFIGTMYRCTALAAFCELVAMFVTGRLPLPEAVRLAGEGCGDADLAVQFKGISDCLAQGELDVELFRRLTAISPHLIHVFHYKDRDAHFVEALLAAARVYENQAKMQIAMGGLLLEPTIIVGVLGGVMLFAVAVFAPLITLLNSLS